MNSRHRRTNSFNVLCTENTANGQEIGTCTENCGGACDRCSNGVVFPDADPDTEQGFTRVTNERKGKRQRVSSEGTSSSQISSQISLSEYQKLSVDDKLSVMFSHMNDIGVKVDKCVSLGEKVDYLETCIDDQNDRLLYLEYKSLDLEARSRRNNLIISGLTENQNENCAELISNFLQNRLNIHPCPPIPRVHRLGRYTRGKTRPVIVYFLDSRDTEFVLSQAKLLRNTDISINRDFPKEILNARKSLWSDFKSLRRDFPNSRVSIVYPAKLIKDGRVIKDMFPNWSRVLRQSPELHVQLSDQLCSGDDHTDRNSVDSREQVQSPVRSQATQAEPPTQDPGHRRAASANVPRRSRNASQSPRRGRQNRGRAPSRQQPSRTKNSAHNSAAAGSQFSRPWTNPHGSREDPSTNRH